MWGVWVWRMDVMIESVSGGVKVYGIGSLIRLGKGYGG